MVSVVGDGRGVRGETRVGIKRKESNDIGAEHDVQDSRHFRLRGKQCCYQGGSPRVGQAGRDSRSTGRRCR